MNIAFIYYTNLTDAIGIDNKMLSYKNAAIKLNHKAIILKIYSNNLMTEFNIYYKILNSSNDIYYIRYNNSKNIFLFFLIIILKLKSKVVILDVPTPITNYLKELDLNSNFSFKKILIKFNTYILGPLPFLISNLVVHYAEESSYFNPKNVKSILIGNGIDANEIIRLIKTNDISNLLHHYNFDNQNYLNLVSIGSIAPWHGWDKFINLISEINERRLKPIRYYIIGEGVELDNLKKLVIHYKLERSVFFLGKMKREDYVPFISCCDLGIGSLAWDRVGVKIASPLKSREYVCCGIPVVFTAFDIDLSNTDYGFEIDSRDSSILEFFSSYEKTENKIDKNSFILFSLQFLDMNNKLLRILKKINL